MKVVYPKSLTESEEIIISEISFKCGILKETARLLFERGIRDFDSAKQFLNPSKTHLLNPFDLSGMKDAVAAMKEKIADGSVDSQIKILEAMTAEERADPERVFANAKNRIAETAGCSVRDVEHLIKQYMKMKQQMAMIQKMGGMEAVMQRMQQSGGTPGGTK